MKTIALSLLATLALATPVPAGTEADGHASQPRVLVLLAQGFNRIEYYGPAATLQSLGYQLVIASPLTGTVPLDKDGQPSPGRDVPVDLALTAVRAADYAALFVPGGYSPAHLENNPEAVRIAREFLEAGKPVGMICHGPRLLIKNGLAKNRTLTCLFTVPDELAGEWVREPFRRYLDQPVVPDGNLLTARYPNDAAAFSRDFARLIASHLKTPPPAPRTGRVLWLRTDHPDKSVNGNIVSTLRVAAEALGFVLDPVGVSDPARLEKALATPFDAVAWDLSPEDLAKLAAPARATLEKAPRHVARTGLTLAVAPSATAPAHQIGPWAVMLAGAAPVSTAEVPNQPPSAAPAAAAIDPSHWTRDPSKARAVLAPRDGFDDETVAALIAALAAAQKIPVLVVHDQKTVRGVNGLELTVGAAYTDALPKDLPVFAPGFFWPQKNREARQAVQPEWVDDLEKRDAARETWLMARRDAGHPLLLAGLDSLRIARRPDMKGLAFSSSEQTVWSFPKEGGRYSRDPFTRTADRLWTVRGSADIPAALAAMTGATP